MEPHFDFSRIQDVEGLAKLLGFSTDVIEEFRQDANKGCLKVLLKKKNTNRGFREIVATDDEDYLDLLKALNSRLTRFTSSKLVNFPMNCVHGYIKGRSIKTNALVHCGSRFMLKADVENFFQSIQSADFREIFLSLGVSNIVSDALIDLATFEGRVPLGLPTSPLLSNIYFHELDKKLFTLASKYGCRYSRYSDDIVFSSTYFSLPSKREIVEILAAKKLTLSPHKYSFKKRGQSYFVTGLSVSESDRPRVSKKFKRSLRMALYCCKKFGLPSFLERSGKGEQATINELDGKIRFLKQIEPEKGGPLLEEWERVLRHNCAAPGFPSRTSRQGEVDLYIDEVEFPLKGTPRLALCVVVVAKDCDLGGVIESFHAQEKSSPYITGNPAVLDKPLHWNEISVGVRNRFIEKISKLNFRTYFNFKILNGDSFEDTYCQILGSLVRRRLTYLDGCKIRIFLEQNSRVNQDKIKGTISQIFNSFHDKGLRSPVSCEVVIAGKADCRELFLSDAIAGVVRKQLLHCELESAAKERATVIEIAETFYFMLSNKIKLIVDLDRGTKVRRSESLKKFFQ